MRLRWTLSARANLEDIGDYIATSNPGAAFKLLGEIVNRTEAVLTESPNAGRAGRVAGTREWVVGGTSYIIVYRLRDDIEILAVIHAARQWPERFEH